MHAPRGIRWFLPLLGALVGAGPESSEHVRALDARSLDQPSLDAEGFGEKKALKRADDGLRVALAAGAEETGWKLPESIRVGGDFSIAAEIVARAMPRPTAADGVAVGLAIAFQSIDQPDATFLRVVEPDGTPVYRALGKFASAGEADPTQAAAANAMRAVGGNPNPNPARPAPSPRETFPAAGETFRLELRREGQAIRFLVSDGRSGEARQLSRITLPPGDVTGIKLFAANRNGAGPVEATFKELTIRGERVTGRGTIVRTIFGREIGGDPVAIRDGSLVVGGSGGSAPAAGADAAPSPSVAPTPAVAPAARAAVAPRMAVIVAPAGAAMPALRIVPAIPARIAAPLVAAAPAAAPAPAPAKPQAPASPAGPDLPEDVFAPAADAAANAPRAVIPLDRIEGIRFEREPAFAARLVGQPNVDVTRGAPAESKAAAKPRPDDVAAPPPGTVSVKPPVRIEAAPNGIRDLRVALSGLRPSKIRQIQITCQNGSEPTTWGLDGSGGWPLVLRRAGTDPTAVVLLEPPPTDCHQKPFSVNVTYEDGQSASAGFQADSHSDAKLAFDAKAPGLATPDARVFLVGGDKLSGTLEGIADDVLKVTAPWRETLAVPLSRIAGFHVALEDRKESPESFESRLRSRGAEDLLLARARNGEVVPIAGVLEGIEAGRLKFSYQGKSRSLPIGQVEGVVLADRPPPSDEGPLATFVLLNGTSLTGRWTAIDGADWKLEAPWGESFKLPVAEVREVRFRGGGMTHLSDLEPVETEEASYFGRPSPPWRRDASLAGGKLKINGRSHDRGIALHSRCVLTYELDGRFETFEALVGFDDEARGKGRVDLRILADDAEVFAEPDFRGDSPPIPLKLKIAGAARLKIVVDFGRGQDVGDRLILADARLFRADATEPSR